MPRTLGRISFALIAALALWPVASAVAASPGTSSLTSGIVGTPIRSIYVRPPRNAPPAAKLQVLVALHGMGGNGESFSKDLIEQADKFSWLLVAPTIDYGDWTNPNVVAREDPLLINALVDYLDQLPQRLGVPTRRQVLILGHSRGAQLAHRFAEFRPDKVLAVAALSAGTYTLPESSGPRGGLSFPYGVKDLARYAGHAFDSGRFGLVQFWVGVGGQDTNPADLPRQWDSVEGTTRVQRAQAFEAAMQKLGARAVLRVFGDAKHEVTGEMRLAACAFLGAAMSPRAPYGTPLAEAPLPL
jgi:pimeloyl-ACP methyl ester carboxylesterase